MKAAVFKGINILSVEDVKKPAVPEGGLLLKVQATGICGTDVRIFRGRKMVTPPRIIGHEFSGIVASVSDRTGGLKEGDRVVVEAIIPCGTCYACRRGEANICVSRKTLGYELDGGFAEYVAIPAEAVSAGCVIKLPDNVSFAEAAACEPAAACINGRNKISSNLRESILISGDGPVGLIHMELAKALGFKKVLMAGTDNEKLSLAKRLGADAVLNVREDNLAPFIKSVCGEDGVDCVIVANNNRGSLEECIQLLRKGGEVVIFAGYKSEEAIEINLNLIHYREIKIKGSSGHSKIHMKEAVDLVSNGSLDLKSLITHELKPEQIVEGIKMKEELVGIKHIIKF